MNANELLKTSYTGSSNTGDLMLCYTMKQVEAIRTALSAPTFEDAIKVVEDAVREYEWILEKKEKNNEPPVNIAKVSWAVDTARTILKILRERGKSSAKI